MDKQFTASEVRTCAEYCTANTKDPLIGQMLHQCADLLEAQEKAVPVATVRWHPKHGFNWRDVGSGPHGDLHTGWIDVPLYTHPAPADAERLAEAQPPAASVTGAVEVSFEVWQDDEMVAECSGPEPSALHEARHYAAQYSQDGAVKLFRVSRVAISAAQENPNG